MTEPSSYPALYLQGIALFNAREFYQAHDVWEELWRGCSTEPRRFFQALIQAAIALYHHQRGHASGALRLARVSREKMESYPVCYYGLNWKQLWNAIDATLAGQADSLPTIVLGQP